MKEKVYVDRLFADYEDTLEIKDFKEEITGNLKERVREFTVKGLSGDEAFEKATAELGDISALADEIGKRKRNEAIGQMYVGMPIPMSKKTAAAIALATGLLLFGLTVGLISFFSTGEIFIAFSGAAVFVSLSIAIYTFAGLARESVSHYAMRASRAAIYALCCGVMTFGIFMAVAMITRAAAIAALGISLVFVLSSVCVLIFLLTTETKREKPWLKALTEKEEQKAMNDYSYSYNVDVDPVKSAKFGVRSGGLWILTIAVFITLGFLIGWKFSWLVFLFALAIQVFMVSGIFGKER